MSSPGIYESVMGQGQDPVLGQLDAADPFAAADQFDQIPVMSQEDYSSLYSGTLTKNAEVYDKVQSAPTQVNNPRQADRVSDQGGVAGKIVRMAESFVGTPYVWGGTSPSGFDCSGFVQYVMRKAAGVNLPRVSFQQASAGSAVAFDKARPGDLMWWDNSTRNNGADHIAIYLGGGMIAEAPRPGVALRIRRVSANEGAHVTRVI